MAKDIPLGSSLSMHADRRPPRLPRPQSSADLRYPRRVVERRGGISRPKRRAVGVVGLCLALVAPSIASATVLVTKPGRGANQQIAQALARALGEGELRVVELSGDLPADSARIARETGGEPIVFAIGPGATEMVGEVKGPAVVSLRVPNPARVKTAGAYVSIYPPLERVLGFVSKSLGARRAGLLFTPAQNREIALSFLKAGESAGVTVVPVPVSSSGDLIRQLKKHLPAVDVLLLAFDPIVFQRRSLEYVVKEARSAGKPTLGFIEELTGHGVTISLIAPPEAVAAAAVAAAEQPVRVGKRRIEVAESVVVVSRSAARAVGLDPEAIGAQRTR
jgi:ABC-type uncharacterized transport system substrate-binding protein